MARARDNNTIPFNRSRLINGVMYSLFGMKDKALNIIDNSTETLEEDYAREKGRWILYILSDYELEMDLEAIISKNLHALGMKLDKADRLRGDVLSAVCEADKMLRMLEQYVGTKKGRLQRELTPFLSPSESRLVENLLEHNTKLLELLNKSIEKSLAKIYIKAEILTETLEMERELRKIREGGEDGEWLEKVEKRKPLIES